MSLAKEIAFLTNPDPKVFVVEEELDDTAAKLTDKGDVDETLDVGGTRLRRQALLTDDHDDLRYSGKTVSRKRVKEWDAEKEADPLTEDLESADDVDDEVNSNSEKDDSEEESDELKNEADEMVSSTDDDMSEDISETMSESGSDDESLEDFKNKMKATEPKQSQSFSFSDDGDYSKYADSDDNDDEISEDDEVSNDDESEDDEDLSDENANAENLADVSMFSNQGESEVQPFSHTDIADELKRGNAAKQQLRLWDLLLESRIRLQKSVVAVNQLPQPDVWEEFNAEGGEEYNTALRDSEKCMKHLLDQLVQLQSLLLLQSPDTSKLVKQEGNGQNQSDTASEKPSVKKSEESDEEIESDDEMEGDKADDKEDKEEEEMEKERIRLKRKIKLSSYPEFLAKRHKTFQTYRDDTIQKWYDKTRVASGKLSKGFSAFESSAVKQIQQILSDKNRLVKRTQLRRSTYRILGKQLNTGDQSDDDQQQTESSPHPLRKDHLKDYDPEIFDDDDFYHQLLRQLIERKTADVDDPVALTRQWLEIQKLRNKVKRKIDTKASKGRKLRYDIHTKLVNFMAPFDTCSWTDSARNDLYSSLFGKRMDVPATNGDKGIGTQNT